MKPFLVFAVFLECGMNVTNGQANAQVSSEVLLSFEFNPDFNSFFKYCCKFILRDCLIFVKTSGYAHDSYKGRMKTNEYSGRLDIRIWNLRASDTGIYRCAVEGTHYPIYKDFRVNVVVSDVDTDRRTKLNPLLPILKSTLSTSVTSVHHVLDKHHEENSKTWHMKLILGPMFGVVIIISIILAMVYHKKKVSGKSGSHSIAPDIAQSSEELSNIVYTTLVFKPCEETSELYANLCSGSRNSRAAGPDPGITLKTQETVEYSTIARVLG